MGPLRPAVRVFSALAVEIGWMATHLATYPLGLLRDAGDDVDPRVFGTNHMSLAQRSLLAADVSAAATPIVLIHGMVDNRTIFAMLRRGLRRRGFSCIRTFSYGPQTSDVRDAASSLGGFVEALCEQTGADKVHIVGHSLGGLIARYYVQVCGGSDRVESVVTLGTPHQGTVAAWLVPHHMVRQLLPDSEILAELAAPAPDCTTRFVAFYSDVDQMVIPADHGRLEHPDLHAENVLVHGLGHLSLPISGRIVHHIGTTLAGVAGQRTGVTRHRAGPPVVHRAGQRGSHPAAGSASVGR